MGTATLQLSSSDSRTSKVSLRNLRDACDAGMIQSITVAMETFPKDAEINRCGVMLLSHEAASATAKIHHGLKVIQSKDFQSVNELD